VTTSNVPFAAIIQGRNHFRFDEIGWGKVLAGLALYFVLVFLHPYLFWRETLFEGGARRMSTARGLLLAVLCSFGLALAQTPFPSKPIRLIVTSPPGGSNDILIESSGRSSASSSLSRCDRQPPGRLGLRRRRNGGEISPRRLYPARRHRGHARRDPLFSGRFRTTRSAISRR